MNRTVGGGWGLTGWHRTVELQAGERVLYEACAVWNAGWLGSTCGKLYATNQRLIWVRDRLMPPIPRQPILVIAVGDILGTEMKRPPFEFRWRLLIQTRDRSYWFIFIPLSPKKEIEECRGMIEKARGQHETRD